MGADGWRVLVHGRDRARGERVVAEIKAAGGAAEFLQADLSSMAEVRRLAEAVRRTTDRLDLLINNAGIGRGEPEAGASSAPTASSCVLPSIIFPDFCSRICCCRC